MGLSDKTALCRIRTKPVLRPVPWLRGSAYMCVCARMAFRPRVKSSGLGTDIVLASFLCRLSSLVP